MGLKRTRLIVPPVKTFAGALTPQTLKFLKKNLVSDRREQLGVTKEYGNEMAASGENRFVQLSSIVIFLKPPERTEASG